MMNQAGPKMKRIEYETTLFLGERVLYPSSRVPSLFPLSLVLDIIRQG